MLTLIDEPDSHNHPPEPDWHVLCYMRSNDDNTYDFWSVYESRAEADAAYEEVLNGTSEETLRELEIFGDVCCATVAKMTSTGTDWV